LLAAADSSFQSVSNTNGTSVVLRVPAAIWKSIVQVSGPSLSIRHVFRVQARAVSVLAALAVNSNAAQLSALTVRTLTETSAVVSSTRQSAASSGSPCDSSSKSSEKSDAAAGRATERQTHSEQTKTA